MRRTTRLLRLGTGTFSTVAAVACWATAAIAQQPGLPIPAPVTATPMGAQPTIPFTAPNLLVPVKSAAAPDPAASNRGPRSSDATPATAVTATTPTSAVTAAAPVTTTVTSPVPADPFLAQLDLAIEVSSRRFLTANVHSPWQIFHGLLPLKQKFQLNHNGQKVNAIEWIATSEPKFDNQPLLMKTVHGGKFHSFSRPYAFEGHPAQFLALLSQSDLPPSFAFKVGNDQITIGGIINNTRKEGNTREEVTWVLWALQHYLRPDAQWLNQHNEAWSIERLVQIESAALVVGASCGGNHRLFALICTRDKHLKHGGQLVGVWAQADYKIRQHIEIARSLQNYDGTFSSKFYETSGYSNDLNSRFNTSGHTMEFLSIALPDARLNEQWIRNAVAVLCNDLVANRSRVIDCGPLYHTLNSLIIYRDRVQLLQKSVAPVPTALPQVAESGSSPRLEAVSTPVPLVASKPANTANPVESPSPTQAAPGAVSISIEVPMAASKPTPGEDALNELKLDVDSRDRLKALTTKRIEPPAIRQDQPGRPLTDVGQPVLEESEEPISALAPENG